jgi:hypothetical protein
VWGYDLAHRDPWSVLRRSGALWALVETSCLEVAANPRRFYGSLSQPRGLIFVLAEQGLQTNGSAGYFRGQC